MGEFRRAGGCLRRSRGRLGRGIGGDVRRPRVADETDSLADSTRAVRPLLDVEHGGANAGVDTQVRFG